MCVISLVSIYALTEASDLTVKEAFYAALESVVDKCPGEIIFSSWGISMHRLELIGMVMRRVLVPMGQERFSTSSNHKAICVWYFVFINLFSHPFCQSYHCKFHCLIPVNPFIPRHEVEGGYRNGCCPSVLLSPGSQ